jgi:hypothetical protein
MKPITTPIDLVPERLLPGDQPRLGEHLHAGGQRGLDGGAEPLELGALADAEHADVRPVRADAPVGEHRLKVLLADHERAVALEVGPQHERPHDRDPPAREF